MNARRWTVGEAVVFRLVQSRMARACWLRLLRACFGLKLIGEEEVPRERAVIFAGNHASHFDGMFSITLAWWLQQRDPSVIAWSGLRGLPVAAQMVTTGAVDFILADEGPMTRQKAAALFGAMLDRLEAGQSIVLHAEGYRRDTLGEFMPGAAAAALVAGVPIVPFTLRGVRGLWQKLPWPDRWHGEVSVVFHPLLQPSSYAHLPRPEAATAMTAELRRRVASAIDYPDEFASASDPLP